MSQADEGEGKKAKPSFDDFLPLSVVCKNVVEVSRSRRGFARGRMEQRRHDDPLLLLFFRRDGEERRSRRVRGEDEFR